MTPEGEKETARLEAFSDGVFAIAMTLLVLDLKVPTGPVGSGTLLRDLGRQWPAYAALMTSFATVGIMWINHHRLFTLIRRVDHGLLIFNTLLLFGITVVPFPTAVLAAHHWAKTAAMVYSGTFVVLALLFNLLWHHARRNNRLLRPDVDAAAVREIDRRYASGPILYLACFGLAFVSAAASVVGNLSLAIFFALPERKRARP
jgi:uncharacterized membrane protein